MEKELQEKYTKESRSREDIILLIGALTRDIETIRQRIKDNKYVDNGAAFDMIRENQYRIHTLEWVLGEHERYD